MSPEIRLAKRVVEKYGLQPPIDVQSLVKRYAQLKTENIPFDGVDGICLNLKVPGKTPLVIINKKNQSLRRRFTLAHELGHILIPWHMGTILDRLDPADNVSDDYWTFEKEANNFAAELLMPSDWLESQIAANSDLSKLHRQLVEQCEVSLQASSIRLAQHLPQNIVYAVERGGLVEFSGRTQGTFATSLDWGEAIPDNSFPYAVQHDKWTVDSRTIHWWTLPGKLLLPDADSREWREILDQIVKDLSVPSENQIRFKQSLNASLAAVNGSLKGKPNYSIETLSAALMQRIHSKSEYSALVNHQHFEAFIQKKVVDFLKRPH